MGTEPRSPFEIWSTTHLWLKACGNKISPSFCKEEITTHPDYPSLLSVIDFLEIGGFSYEAIQADQTAIHLFNYPLLAHIKKSGEDHMRIIYSPQELEEKDSDVGYWSGIVIYPGKGARWNNSQHESYRKIQFRNRITALALTGAALGLFIVTLFLRLPLLKAFAPAIGISLFGLLSLSGMIASILTLGVELGFQNQLVKQVCGTVSKGGCEKVLKSRYARSIAGITPADASTAYFTVQFIIYLLGAWYFPLFEALFLFAGSAIIIAASSIYIQAVILKQGCALCLCIVSILVAQSTIAAICFQPLGSLLPETVFACLFAFVILCGIPIKEMLRTNNANKIQLQELKRWKLDGDLFIEQWRQGRKIDASIWQNDLVLGDPNAPLQITVACNPYCGPCARAHTRLDELLNAHGDKIKVQMRFLCNAEKDTDKRTIATKAILQRSAFAENNTELQQILSDWFAWMNYEKWSKKWQSDTLSGQSMAATEEMLRHSQWIKNNEIVSTPTVFINGRKMPGRYSLADIGALLPQLVELTQE